MIEMYVDYCLQARNDEALAWIQLIDAERYVAAMPVTDQGNFFEMVDDLLFIAETMTELRAEVCK